MINKTGKVALSNGNKTIWVNPEDQATWAVHGFRSEQPVAAVLKPRAVKQQEEEEIPSQEEDSANKENE